MIRSTLALVILVPILFSWQASIVPTPPERYEGLTIHAAEETEVPTQPAAMISVQARLADVFGPSNQIRWERLVNPQDGAAWVCWWIAIGVIALVYLKTIGSIDRLQMVPVY